MKKNLILILIFSLFLTIGCSTSSNQIKNSANTISDIQHQIDDLAPKDTDSKEVAKTKKETIKVLQEARKEIITQQQNNAKLEEEKDSLLSYAGVGKFVWVLVGLVIVYFVFKIVKKFIP
jgi:hypothetical protein